MSEERLMRLARLREHLKERELEGLVVVRPENRYYFSGFMGTAGAAVICGPGVPVRGFPL